MRRKLFKILIFLMSLNFSLFGQEIKLPAIRELKIPHSKNWIDSFPKIDSLYFIAGTLSDYMGRSFYVNKKDQVDRYFKYEEPLKIIVTKIIQKGFNMKVDTIKNEMFSRDFAPLLNSFYDNKDLLNINVFKSNLEMYSFILGVYYRYGLKISDSIYGIHLYNSPKNQTCYDLLKKIGCNKIYYQYRQGLPSNYYLYFETTSQLKMYLNQISKQKEILDITYYKFLENYLNNEDLLRDTLKFEEEEKKRIRDFFQ